MDADEWNTYTWIDFTGLRLLLLFIKFVMRARSQQKENLRVTCR